MKARKTYIDIWETFKMYETSISELGPNVVSGYFKNSQDLKLAFGVWSQNLYSAAWWGRSQVGSVRDDEDCDEKRVSLKSQKAAPRAVIMVFHGFMSHMLHGWWRSELVGIDSGVGKTPLAAAKSSDNGASRMGKGGKKGADLTTAPTTALSLGQHSGVLGEGVEDEKERFGDDSDDMPVYRPRWQGSWLESYYQQGYDVWAMDHQGHGRSEGYKEWAFMVDDGSDLFDDAAQFILSAVHHYARQVACQKDIPIEQVKIADLPPIYVKGYSMGGACSLLSVDKLVLFWRCRSDLRLKNKRSKAVSEMAASRSGGSECEVGRMIEVRDMLIEELRIDNKAVHVTEFLGAGDIDSQVVDDGENNNAGKKSRDVVDNCRYFIDGAKLTPEWQKSVLTHAATAVYGIILIAPMIDIEMSWKSKLAFGIGMKLLAPVWPNLILPRPSAAEETVPDEGATWPPNRTVARNISIWLKNNPGKGHQITRESFKLENIVKQHQDEEEALTSTNSMRNKPTSHSRMESTSITEATDKSLAAAATVRSAAGPYGPLPNQYIDGPIDYRRADDIWDSDLLTWKLSPKIGMLKQIARLVNSVSGAIEAVPPQLSILCLQGGQDSSVSVEGPLKLMKSQAHFDLIYLSRATHHIPKLSSAPVSIEMCVTWVRNKLAAFVPNS